MSITHTFKGSKDSYGHGYYAHIEDGQLVIGYNGPREGGELYRGDYKGASKSLKILQREAPKLHHAIDNYYFLTELILDTREPPKGPDKTFKIKLYTRNNCIYNCLVKGPDEEAVIKKLCPSDTEPLVVQTYEAKTFVIYSDMIAAFEFDNTSGYDHSLRI